MATRAQTILIALLAVAALGAQQLVDARTHRDAIKHYQSGREYFAHEDWNRAEAEFQSAVRLDPLVAVAHYYLGRAYMQEKRYPSAIRAYLACREASRTIFELERSQTQTERQRLKGQRQALESALDQPATGRGGQRGRNDAAAQLVDNERRDRELASAQSGVFVVPPELSLALGSAYFRSGATPDAEREYRAALDARPAFGEAHNNLAALLASTGRRDEAIQHVKAAEEAGFRVNPDLKGQLGMK